MRRTWTEEEDSFIRDNPNLTVSQMAHKLNRTDLSVWAYIQRNNLKFKRKGNWFTEKEIEFLRDNPEMTITQMADALGRKYGSISGALRKNNLRYTKENLDKKPINVKVVAPLFESGKSILEVYNLTKFSYNYVSALFVYWLSEISVDNYIENDSLKQQYWERESEIFASIKPEYKEEDLTGDEKGILTLIKKGEIKL